MVSQQVDSSEVDSSATRCRWTFRDRGRTITVTMTSPHVPPNVVRLDVPIRWPVSAVDRPTLVTGWIMPATFRVDGLGVDATFSTRAATRDDGIVFVAIDTVTVSPTVPTTDLDLPLAGLLRAAVKASGVRGIRVPSGERWTWDRADDPTSYRLADDTSSHFMTQDGPSDVWPLYVGPMSAEDEARLNVKAITGTGRATRTVLTDDVLRAVADVYNANTGTGRRAVADHFTIGLSAARERIRIARERGFIDELPSTDKRRKTT